MGVAQLTPIRAVIEALESAAALDSPAGVVGRAVRGAVGSGKLRDTLSGTWLGHALHPLLTDVVIGSFLSATLLDVVGGDDDGGAAERLILVGLATYGPTALTGVSDWSDSEEAEPEVRRVGLAHAASNATALSLYGCSLAARRQGRQGRAKLLGAAGAAALGVASYLGGHMSLGQGVGVNQTAFDPGPDEWVVASGSGDLPSGEPTTVVVGDTPVMLLRDGDGLHALHARCSHRGCSLSAGEVDARSITCPCHGSRFRLSDGAVEHGPATTAQPVYEIRESGGRIEIRRGRGR